MAFEQNKPIEIQDVKDKLDGKVSTSNVLNFSDILAGGNLTGKVASAGAVRSLNENMQVNFLRGNSLWIQNNETQRFRVNTPGSFIFTALGTSMDQWSIYYINNQPPGYIHRILGSGTAPTVKFNNNMELVINNTVGWTVNYFLLGEFTRVW